MDSLKIKEMQCDEFNHLEPSTIQSLTVDTIGDFAGPHGIGKRKFMITDILNNSNKNPLSVHSGSPNSHREPLYPHIPNKFGGGSAFQSLCSSANSLNTTGSSSTSTPPHLERSPNYWACGPRIIMIIINQIEVYDCEKSRKVRIRKRLIW